MEFVKTEKGRKFFLGVATLILLVTLLVANSLRDISDEDLLTNVSKTSFTAESEYELVLESRLSDLISSVEGAGDCKVMLTLEKGEYKIFAKDSYEDENENKYEYVIINGESGVDEGLIVNVQSPEIRGVAVVCEGGDSSVVHAEIVDLLCSVLSVKSTQISVSKMN